MHSGRYVELIVCQKKFWLKDENLHVLVSPFFKPSEGKQTKTRQGTYIQKSYGDFNLLSPSKGVLISPAPFNRQIRCHRVKRKNGCSRLEGIFKAPDEIPDDTMHTLI